MSDTAVLRISDQHADRSDMVNVERPVYLVDNGAKIPILKLPVSWIPDL
jgi:hypothetical protein